MLRTETEEQPTNLGVTIGPVKALAIGPVRELAIVLAVAQAQRLETDPVVERERQTGRRPQTNLAPREEPEPVLRIVPVLVQGLAAERVRGHPQQIAAR
jgi:hypothetical protein